MSSGCESTTRATGTETLARLLREAAVEDLAMDASLTKRRRVCDEGLRVVKHCRGGESRKVDLSLEEARAKFVPAAAVRRTVRTLFGITGLKRRVGGRSSPG